MRVMWPPMKAPNVTAGLTWPPEMLAPTETATKRANAWDSDAATTPAGVAEPLSVSLSAKKKKTENTICQCKPNKNLVRACLKILLQLILKTKSVVRRNF